MERSFRLMICITGMLALCRHSRICFLDTTQEGVTAQNGLYGHRQKCHNIKRLIREEYDI